MTWINEKNNSVKLSIYVQPRASKNAISGFFNNKLKVKLTSPPVGGAANELLVKFLAKKLSLAKSDILILSGDKSRSKVLMVKGISESEVKKSLKIS
ncbi:MAG: DUF167 domain-containing protein [Deltaproteobacteria bacterium]|nr:DUF167 domain-containing protein [Deltaproteobacteria bacterium]